MIASSRLDTAENELCASRWAATPTWHLRSTASCSAGALVDIWGMASRQMSRRLGVCGAWRGPQQPSSKNKMTTFIRVAGFSDIPDSAPVRTPRIGKQKNRNAKGASGKPRRTYFFARLFPIRLETLFSAPQGLFLRMGVPKT